MGSLRVVSRVMFASFMPPVFLVAGCAKPPATTADDVYAYVVNALNHAEVRRMDAGAQEYADTVMKAYFGWMNACNPIVALEDPDALKPDSDDWWRDPNAAEKTLQTIQKWLADEADPDHPDRKTRAEWAEAVAVAIDRVPPLPERPDSTLGDLATAIRGAIDLEAENALLIRIAEAYRHIVQIVVANRDGIDPQKTGLAFQDPEITRAAVAAWQDLHNLLGDARQRELDSIDSILGEERELRRMAIEQKKKIRTETSMDGEHLARFRYLEILIRRYDARIKWAERRQKEIAAAKNRES